MKVGDYVRTKYGIAKIIQDGNIILEKNGNRTIYVDKNGIAWENQFAYYVWSNDIIKSSPNIIDLIEEDDLIKIGYEISTGEIQKEVLQVIKNNEGKLFVNTWIGKRFLEDFINYDIGIFSILTKEQFKQMEYKVGEIE